MNAYFIRTRDPVRITEDVVEAHGQPCEIYYYGYLSDIVVAETRGRAKQLFIEYNERDACLEFTDPFVIRKLCKVEGSFPYVVDDHYDKLWELVGLECWPEEAA